MRGKGVEAESRRQMKWKVTGGKSRGAFSLAWNRGNPCIPVCRDMEALQGLHKEMVLEEARSEKHPDLTV